MQNEVYVRSEAVSKFFPGIVALDNVSIDIKSGTVHALMGENGAGKSTFVKCLMGIKVYDEGQFYLKGKPVKFTHPRKALNSGVSIIEQELSPALEMTVAENIFLGRTLRGKGFLSGLFFSYKDINEKSREILAKLNIDLDVTVKMKYLSTSQMQLVEIAKAVSYDADVIIMDEPTSSIGREETEVLFEIIDKLKKQGKAIIYVSHRMEEIFAITDMISIFRDGKHIDTLETKKTNADEVVFKMVGRKVGSYDVKEKSVQEAVKLEVKNLNDKKLHDINVKLHKGEILGLFGLMGSGRTEFCDSLFGNRKKKSGEVSIDGKSVSIANPRDAINNSIAYVTEDRKGNGLYLKLSVAKNISINSLKKLTLPLFVSSKKENVLVHEMVKAFNVKTPTSKELIVNLSGGNQQKALLGRWVASDPDILILDEPTRGIDIGAKIEIYKFMSDFVKTGKSIILVSSELPEMLGMSDRIYVFSDGYIVKEFMRDDATEAALMLEASKKLRV